MFLDSRSDYEGKVEQEAKPRCPETNLREQRKVRPRRKADQHNSVTLHPQPSRPWVGLYCGRPRIWTNYQGARVRRNTHTRKSARATGQLPLASFRPVLGSFAEAL
jgi:hypothetical protein